jgi:hypothetical protein
MRKSPETATPALPDHWLVQLKNKRPIAAAILIAIVIIGLARFTNAIGDIRRFVREFSEPLTVQMSQLMREPWLNLVPPMSRPLQMPIPMWTALYVTVHNKPGSSNIWIVSYSVSVKTENGWKLLTPPRMALGKKSLYFMWPGNMQSLKPECIFDYTASKGPIAPDGYLSGWMFFESQTPDKVSELKFEFRDKEGNWHRREVDTLTAYLEPPSFELEQDNWPLPPEFKSYQQEMRYHISIFPWLRK